MRALFAALLLAACAAGEAPAQPEAPPVATTTATVTATSGPTEMTITDQWPDPIAPLACAGAFTQGGVALCRTIAGAEISVDGVPSGRADGHGWAIIGFSREHGPDAVVVATFHSPPGAEIARPAEQHFAIAPREFDIQRVNGLPQDTVTPTDPALLERIRREAALKAQGFTSVAPLEGWLEGFIIPVEGGIVTGHWGNQRVLNGTPSSPHFGYDIAAPVGTPIRAPASGVVTLAEPDMHYEGGLIFIDHGEGLITMYLHMSRLDVHVGDHVTQGQVIGAVGARGRATGPHLCWRMKWRDRQLDPSVALTALNEARTQLASAR